MKRLIVYDLDGTLVNTLDDIAQAANQMLQTLDEPPRAAQEIRRFIGSGLHELVRRCLRTDEEARIAHGMRLFRASYAAHLTDSSALYPGARELLEHFKDRRQAVVTNKPSPFSRDLLSALGVADFFFEIVSGDLGYPRKPDPAAVLAVMRRARVEAGETVLIGDSPIDVAAGRNAGAVTVGLLHGFSDEDELAFSGPDVLVRDFLALLDVAKARGW